MRTNAPEVPLEYHYDDDDDSIFDSPDVVRDLDGSEEEKPLGMNLKNGLTNPP